MWDNRGMKSVVSSNGGAGPRFVRRTHIHTSRKTHRRARLATIVSTAASATALTMV